MRRILLVVSIALALAFGCDGRTVFAQTQTAAFKAGFNFISFTIKPSQTPPGFIQSSGGACEDVFSYSSAAGSFISAGEGTLSAFNPGRGYIFKMKNDMAASFSGTAISAVGPISLKAGFNLVGISKLSGALSFTELMKKYGFVRGIYKWNAASGSFIQVVRDAYGAPQALDGIDPAVAAGQAYFINLDADAALDLDSATLAFGGATVAVTPGTTKIIDLGGGVKLEMVYIPAGSFAMGSSTANDRYETPQRPVRITRGFYMAKYETTQAQWQAIMGNNPSRSKTSVTLPVETVSWNDICLPGGFLDKLNQKGAGIFRLPTEAEWEYACRAGTASAYYWGENFDGAYAWYSGFFASDGNSGLASHPVGQKKPNAFGLYDMAGNVMEWCSDWFDMYPASGNSDDPTGPSIGIGSKDGANIPVTHVIRGGGYASNQADCRSAYRYCYLEPGKGWGDVGFRLVMSAETPTYYIDKTVDSVVAGEVYDLSKISMVATFPNGVSQKLVPGWSIVSGGGSLAGTNYTAPGVPGTVLLQATFTDAGAARTANLTLTVTSSVTAVTISGNATVAVGNTTALSATAKNAAGFVVSGMTVAWTSLNTAVATVDQNGLVSAVSAGSAVIRATIGGKSAEITVSVTMQSFLPDKVIDLGGGVKLEMVYIPAGSFTMGTPESEPERGATGYEGPQHKVNITKGFYMGKYEVTQAQWKAVTGDTSDRFSVAGDNFPAFIGSWSPVGGAGGFIEKLNLKGLGSFSLPTEAQWEYACRAGTSTAFYWGAAMNGNYCLYSDTLTGPDLSVGQKLPNAWGLYDMSGSAWEWCRDFLAPYTSPETVNDPVGPATGSRYVMRGGGRYSTPAACRSGARNFVDGGGSPISSTGFRLVMAEEAGTAKTLVRMTLSVGTDSVFVGQVYDLSKISASLQYTGEPLGTPHSAAPQWSLKSGGGSVSGQYFTAPAAPGSSMLQASYSEGGKTVTAVFIMISETPSVTATIGAAGGTVSGSGIKISIPPNALPVFSTINLKSSADISGFLPGNTVGNVYKISGLSDITASTVSVEIEISDASKILKGCSVYVRNTATGKGRFFDAKLVQNKVIANIDDFKSLFTDSFVSKAPGINHIGGNSAPVFQVPINIPEAELRIIDYIREPSPSGRFLIIHSQNFTGLNDVITTLESSYDYIRDILGLSWARLENNPIRVELVPLGATENDDEASYTDAFSLANGVIRINTDRFVATEAKSQATVRHEMFHFMQAIYDSRTVRGSDWWDWMSEATAVCVERDYLRQNNLGHPEIVDKYPSLLLTLRNGLNYTVENNSVTRAQFGYAASMFLSYMIEKKGLSMVLASRVYRDHRDFPNLSPLEALAAAVGGANVLSAMWTDFCVAYITGGIYGNDEAPAFATIMKDCKDRNFYSNMIFTQAYTPKESFFEVSTGSFPFSAVIREMYFEPVTQSTWDFPNDTTNVILELQTNSNNMKIKVFEVRVTPVNKAYGIPVYLPQFDVGRSGKVTIPNVIEYAKNNKSLIFLAVNSESDPAFNTVAFSLKITKEIIRSDKTIDLGNGTKLELMHIPAGSFMMGSQTNSSSGPQHKVTISKGFYIGKFEFTIAQWQAVMGTGAGSLVGYFATDPSDYPAYNTGWNDICGAGGFLERLNNKNLGKFRLPTEAEWEYACRGGTTADTYWSGSIDSYCWYSGNSGKVITVDGIGGVVALHSVGKKLPNKFGLYDMNGNVEEWCSDWYGPYTSDPAIDPKGPATGTAKILRGGNWYDGAAKCSSTARYYEGPSEWFTYRGFRVVMEE